MGRPRSYYTFYDPKTFKIIVEEGQIISSQAEKRLKELGFFEKAAKSSAWGVGKKKQAWARALIKRGRGRIVVNGRRPGEWFGSIRWKKILEPFQILELNPSEWDVSVEVRGSSTGSEAQLKAVRNAIAEALDHLSPKS